MKNKDNKQKGFTLIELLVVIAIIAILSTVVMAGLNSARAKSRDAKRVSEVKSLQKALDLYYDTCGGYPMIDDGAGNPAVIGTGLTTATQDGTCVTSGETFGTYMATLPVNPSPTATQATYDYCSTDAAGTCDPAAGDGYQILFGLEGDTGSLSAGIRTATPSGIQ